MNKSIEMDNRSLLYRIAKSYYVDGKTQEEIAKEESFSRPKISRLLSQARDCGMITFEIHEPVVEERSSLEIELCNKLNLKSVRLIDNITDNVSKDIARGAGQVLPYFLNGSNNVGVGWGYTVYQTAKLMPNYLISQNYRFIPLMGSSGSEKVYGQINVISYLFAEKTNSRSVFTTLPTLQDVDRNTESIENNAVRQIRRQWESIDTAIIGMGAKPEALEDLVYEVPESYFRFLRDNDVIGDVLTHFFLRDGSMLDTSAFYTQISYDLEDLKKLNKVICIAGGQKKVDGLIMAAKNNLYNILITDRITARSILSRM